MFKFSHPCPDCGATSEMHETDCRHAEAGRAEIERAYFSILRQVAAMAVAPPDERRLGEVIDGWGSLHADCLKELKRRYRVAIGPVEGAEDLCPEGVTGDGYRVVTPEERREAVAEPDIEPVATIYEEGSVSGAHDNAVFSIIAYYEMVGLSWEETRTRVVSWLEDTGTWDRGGFEEDNPEKLVDSKRHVYEEGYGWKDKAEAAKRVITRELNTTN